MWTKKEWSKIDECTLKRVYPDPKWIFDEIAELFPERTPAAIRSKAHYMGLHRPIINVTSHCMYCGQELPKKEAEG
jgi:hypothetical protein